LLVTERPGRLRVIEPGADGRLVLRAAPVAGVPPVLARGQAGLFEVLLHPAFASNGLLYLSFAHGTPQANHLRVVRARFDGQQLLDVLPVFTSMPAKTDTQHFGGRLVWLPDGTLVLGMGDGNLERTDAQRLHTHLGKLLRINADGSVPADNPFVQRADARPEIWSLGHRNIQGAALHPATHAGLWLLDRRTLRLHSPGGAQLLLTGTEARLLQGLFEARGEVLGRDALCRALGPAGHVPDTRRLDSLISRLRSKVEQQGGGALPIQTFRNLGYAFGGPCGVGAPAAQEQTLVG